MLFEEFDKEFTIHPLVNGLRDREVLKNNWIDYSLFREFDRPIGFEVTNKDNDLVYAFYSDAPRKYLPRLKKQFGLEDFNPLEKFD